ncbi:MAG: hypothetical protein MMC33_008336 [Icmadophila ericetorum]|nr:hypothetical protein [Icmadophila ericetorum]
MWKAKHSPPAPPSTTTRFTGKTILITGSNTGLGFRAAEYFVALDAGRVILGVRTSSKGEAAKAHIEAQTGRKGVVDVMQIDMNNFDYVKAFSAKVEAEVPKLDIAVLNAGCLASQFSKSSEGFETMIQVNCLSTTLLALLLLPKLCASKPSGPSTVNTLPRLVIVTSRAYETIAQSQLPSPAESLIDANNKPFKDHLTQYAMSKFFIQMNFHSLHELVDGDEILVTSCCPGATQSDLSRDLAVGAIMRFGVKAFGAVFMRTTEEGSRTLVTACTLSKEAAGKLWRDDKLDKEKVLVTGEEGNPFRQQLWKENYRYPSCEGS